MEFKKLSAVEAVEAVSDTASVLIEENGVIKKAPKDEVGGVNPNKLISVEAVSDTANVLIEENGVIKKAPKIAVGGSPDSGNVFEDIVIFLWNGDEPRIEYAGGVVPLWGNSTYWYFSDEPAGAKLVDELNDTNRHFRFIVHTGAVSGSKSIFYGYSYETSTTPSFTMIFYPNNMTFTREAL